MSETPASALTAAEAIRLELSLPVEQRLGVRDPWQMAESLIAALDAARTQPGQPVQTLDVAWKTAEKALSEGWRLHSIQSQQGGMWLAVAGRRDWVLAGRNSASATDVTPAVALLALADKLAHRDPSDSGGTA